ncbi:MAG: hypothetical protein ABH820_04155 [Patescibacteria group bacterium]|nr:hypothetical protein [Patescibacteria group bacterium]MBU2509006.1 hypothetical protein [Patescibacteria group bacterium]
MRRLWIIIIEMFIFMIGMALIYGCETEEARLGFLHATDKEENIEEREYAPSKRIAIQPDIQSEEAPPETKPEPEPEPEPEIEPEIEPTEYVTDIITFNGCGYNPIEMAVAKSHISASACEYISATGAMDYNGDFFETSALFIWETADPNVVTFECNAYETHCEIKGKQDIFDQNNGQEPKSEVKVCALNDCPDPNPGDCQKKLCSSVLISSVINLSGIWNFYGDFLSEISVANLTQDGRHFWDKYSEIENGVINEDMMHFEKGNLIYKGKIAPDRKHIQGDVVEVNSLSLCGQWSAKHITAS